MAITKVIKTCIKLVADNQQDFQSTVNKLQQILDLSEAEKMAVLEESLTIIVNTDIQSEIDDLNALSQAMLDAENQEQMILNRLSKATNLGIKAIFKMRITLAKFYVARALLKQADPTSTVYDDITDEAVFAEFQDYIDMLDMGMIQAVKTRILALPSNHWLLSKSYPIGQTTTNLSQHYVAFLDELLAELNG